MKTVLIADDRFDTREMLRHMFAEWNVAEAADGQDAVEKVAQLMPDLVILDFKMPVMNGLEAAVAIKRIRPRLPVILFTAYKDDSLEKQAYDKGFSVVVSKGEAANRLMDSARILLKYGGDTAAAGQSYNRQSTEELSLCSESTVRGPKVVDAGAGGRIALDIPGTVYSDRHGFVPALICDINERGFSALLPMELSLGEVVKVELRFPQEVKRVQAIIRNRNAFHHGFELLRDNLSNEVMRLMEES